MKPMREDLMVQQQVKTVWQHMVGVMCLNLTYRKQVKEILPKLFKKYPNPKAFLRGRVRTQENMLRPLGMWNVRTKRIRKRRARSPNQATNIIISRYASRSVTICYS